MAAFCFCWLHPFSPLLKKKTQELHPPLCGKCGQAAKNLLLLNFFPHRFVPLILPEGGFFLYFTPSHLLLLRCFLSYHILTEPCCLLVPFLIIAPEYEPHRPTATLCLNRLTWVAVCYMLLVSSGIYLIRYWYSRRKFMAWWDDTRLSVCSAEVKAEKSTLNQDCTWFTGAPCWKIWETSDTYMAPSERCWDHYPPQL